MSRNLFETEQVKWVRRDAHPHEVHLLATLHEGPDLGAEFFPHALQVMEDSQLLEGLVHLESGREPESVQIEERQRQWAYQGSLKEKNHQSQKSLPSPFSSLENSSCSYNSNSNTQGQEAGSQGYVGFFFLMI